MEVSLDCDLRLTLMLSLSIKFSLVRWVIFSLSGKKVLQANYHQS